MAHLCAQLWWLTWLIAISQRIFFSNSFFRVSSKVSVTSLVVDCSFLISDSSNWKSRAHYTFTHPWRLRMFTDISPCRSYLFVFFLLFVQFFTFLFKLFVLFFLLIIPLAVGFAQNKLWGRYFLWSPFNRSYVPFMLI